MFHNECSKALRIIGLLSITLTPAWAQSTIWTAWGNNVSGQLGNGTTTGSSLPLPATALSDMVAVTGGLGHSLGLKSDGTVWAWGNNDYGQLGIGSNTNSSIPVPVLLPAPVPTALPPGVFTAIAAGREFSLALRDDGTVWAWGRNTTNQLGDNTTIHRSTPFAISGLTGVTAIAAGAQHSLALLSDGTLKGWGIQFYDEINASSHIVSSPVVVSGMNNVIAVKAGTWFSVALRSDGTVWTWGNNQQGQLGVGSDDLWRASPGPVSQLSGVVTAIAVGSSGYHTLALTTDGSVWAWGLGYLGQLGNGAYADSNLPVKVSGVSQVTAMAAGTFHNLVTQSDGKVYSWGGNSSGQLGIGTTPSSSIPVHVAWLANATTLGAGYSTSFAQTGNSAELAINGLIGTLQGAHLTLNAGQMNSLLVKLRNAMNRLASKNRSAAISQLQAFTAELTSLVTDGVITSSSAAPLIAAANSIIAMI